jgi:hypothetical protein
MVLMIKLTRQAKQAAKEAGGTAPAPATKGKGK